MLTIDYDPLTDTAIIEGISYAGQFFRDFARDLDQGQLMRFVSRDNGVVCIERVEQGL